MQAGDCSAEEEALGVMARWKQCKATVWMETGMEEVTGLMAGFKVHSCAL